MKRDDWVEADVAARMRSIDGAALEGDLDAQGWSVVRDLLSAAECDELAALYVEDAGFAAVS